MESTALFPDTFPDAQETKFLEMLFCDGADFPQRFLQWQQEIVFNDINHATLKLLPLLYLRLRKTNIESRLMGRIAGVYRLAWVKNQRLLHELVGVADMLESHGISPLLLKGIPLILNTYHDIGARFLGDADILLHPADAKPAILLMQSRGWKLATRFPDFQRLAPESLDRITKEAHFRSEQGVEIDIHWRLFSFSKKEEQGPVMPPADLFQHSVPVAYKGKTYRGASNEDMLLHVIAQGAEPASQKSLRWIADAVWLMKENNINWDLFFENAKKYGFQTEVFFAFSYLLQQHFIALGEPATKNLLPLQPSQASLQTYYATANAKPQTVTLLGNIPQLWYNFNVYESKAGFPANPFGFFQYLCAAWGVNTNAEVASFLFTKLKRRLFYSS